LAVQILFIYKEQDMNKLNNIALIGMAGVGKSFVGRHLAEKLGYSYVELDKLITCEAGKIGVNKDLLADNEFIKLEEKIVLGLDGKNNSVFDTGGSVIYSSKAMGFLKLNSVVIYLKDSVENTTKRFDDRGELHLVGIKGKTFDKLLEERNKLYEKYADFSINVFECKNSQDILNKIVALV